MPASIVSSLFSSRREEGVMIPHQRGISVGSALLIIICFMQLSISTRWDCEGESAILYVARVYM